MPRSGRPDIIGPGALAAVLVAAVDHGPFARTDVLFPVIPSSFRHERRPPAGSRTIR
jgi:hypothetical protein